MIEGGSHNNNNNIDNQAIEENNKNKNNNHTNTQDPNEIPAINITYNNKSYQPDDEEAEQIAVEPNPDYALPTNTTLPKNQNKMDDPIQTSEPIQNNNINDPVTPTISPEKPAVERKQSSSILKKQGSEKNGNSRSVNKKATFENSNDDGDQDQKQKQKELTS